MEKRPKLIGPKAVIVDIVLTLLFFVIMTTLLRPYVPAQEEPYITIFAIFTSTCISGVFWMAVQCFRVTLVDQLNQSKSVDK